MNNMEIVVLLIIGVLLLVGARMLLRVESELAFLVTELRAVRRELIEMRREGRSVGKRDSSGLFWGHPAAKEQ